MINSDSLKKIFLISDETIRGLDVDPSLQNKITHFRIKTIRGGFLFNYPYFFIKSFFLIRNKNLEKKSDLIIANNSIATFSKKKISIMHNSQLLLGF